MRKLNLTIILSLAFVFFFYFTLWIGGFSAVFLMFFTGIIGLFLIFLILKEVFVKKNYLAFGIGIFALCIVIFRPIEYIIESLKSPIVACGYCEHTMTSLSINLRKNKTFEYNAGAFLEKEMYSGNYTVKNDTLVLNFNEPFPKRLKDTLIYQDNWLNELGKEKEKEHNHNFKLTTNSIWK
ncbi:hypothetical protein WMW71_12970 [Flavobacterium buctense]|uniref:DUF4131 domain-containing protein n=1 Tax=Flavobacterium buctense TaxID=1648146 RepID=A0ABU9E5T7_9FLAO|nr:hypothetical protein [Flavobacterium buctense]